MLAPLVLLLGTAAVLGAVSFFVKIEILLHHAHYSDVEMVTVNACVKEK